MRSANTSAKRGSNSQQELLRRATVCKHHECKAPATGRSLPKKHRSEKTEFLCLHAMTGIEYACQMLHVLDDVGGWQLAVSSRTPTARLSKANAISASEATRARASQLLNRITQRGFAQSQTSV